MTNRGTLAPVISIHYMLMGGQPVQSARQEAAEHQHNKRRPVRPLIKARLPLYNFNLIRRRRRLHYAAPRQ